MLTPDHLSRTAIVYIRQSSNFQVRNNVERRRLQHELVSHARGPGFSRVEVIDDDLGVPSNGVHREGCERLLTAGVSTCADPSSAGVRTVAAVFILRTSGRGSMTDFRTVPFPCRRHFHLLLPIMSAGDGRRQGTGGACRLARGRWPPAASPVFSAFPAGVMPAGNTPGSGPPADGQFWNGLQGRKMQTSCRAATRRLQGTWRKGRRRSHNIHPALRRQVRQRGTGKRVSCSGVSVQATLMMVLGKHGAKDFPLRIRHVVSVAAHASNSLPEQFPAGITGAQECQMFWVQSLDAPHASCRGSTAGGACQNRSRANRRIRRTIAVNPGVSCRGS